MFLTYTCMSFSESCPSKNEICNTYEKTCTSSYTSPGLLELIPFGSRNAGITVRATSAAWNASSEPYTFHTLNICKYLFFFNIFYWTKWSACSNKYSMTKVIIFLCVCSNKWEIILIIKKNRKKGGDMSESENKIVVVFVWQADGEVGSDIIR